MSNGVIVHSNQLSRVGVNKQVLKNGSSVLVRVISDNGNGKYTGSVAGVRVNLKSNQNLKIGSTFIASISQKDGTIYISPKENFVTAENFKLETLNNNQIFSLLQNLGIPLDKISVNLFKQFKQLEMKLDSSVLYKLHNLSLRFKGKEKKASEIYTILLEKKLNGNDDEIFQLLALLENDKDFSNQSYRQGKSLLNRINKNIGSWFILPFEMIQKETQQVLGKGCLRLLYDKTQELKILNIDCNAFGKRNVFNLNFEKKNLRKIRFNLGDNNPDKLLTALEKKISGVDIEWAELEDIEGSSCNSEEFYSYEGVV